MVKVPLPKTAPNFDKVVVHYANSTKPNEISRVEFEGAGALKTVAGTTKNLWIHDPSNTSGTQGGAHGDFNLEINDAYVNMNCLCTYPKRDRFESITITIKAVGYTVTGSEQYYSEKAGAWKTKYTYDKGTLLSEGSIVIKQEEFEGFYVDKNVKIVFPDPSISFVKTKTITTNSGMAPDNLYKVITCTSTTLDLVETGQKESQQKTSVVINIVKEADIENLDSYKKAKAANAAYTPLQYTKDAIECWYKYKSFGCTPADDMKKNKYNTDIHIGSIVPNGFIEELYKGMDVSNELLKKKEVKNQWILWSDKTMGKNTFGYGYIEKMFMANCLTGKPEYNPSKFESVEFYVYYKKPNIYIISPYYVNDQVRGQYYDEQKQKGYVKFVMENIEFQ